MSRTHALQVKETTEGPWTRLSLAGPINEDAKAVLMPYVEAAGPRVILDMAGVTHLNSVGIRDWSLFLKSFKASREIVFDRCTDEVVRTMNMVTNFHYRLPVRSLYRAYGCEHCGHEQMVALSEGRDYRPQEMPTMPPVRCESCGEQTEAFVMDEEFFQFLMGA